MPGRRKPPAGAKRPRAKRPRATERERASEIVRRLRETYPANHPLRPFGGSMNPLSELIFTVLSQNTSDVNRDKAWASMRKRYPKWEQVVAARPRDLAASIAVGGLSNVKAPRIREILREVKAREGRYSLARLQRVSDAEATEYLLSLPGIGPKTAACVLAFSLGRPRLPVDTHVHRVARRLALADARSTPEQAQAQLEALIPEADRIEAHVTLIAHGRGTCRAQRPACGSCVLLDVCPAGPALLARASAPRNASSNAPRIEMNSSRYV